MSGALPRGRGCGSTALPCTVPEGAYFAAAPTWHAGDPPRPAVVFLHGAGGSGAAAVEDPNLAAPIAGRGYVLLAPTGLARPGRDGFYWSLGSRPPVRDEAAFLAGCWTMRSPRFHLDRNRVFVTGFSMGAGVVWQLACHDPGAYAAYGPIAGGFWRGQPTGCAGPVKMLLTHGWRDDAVPLEGWERGPGGPGRHLRRGPALATASMAARTRTPTASPQSPSSGSGRGPTARPAPP